MMRHGRSSSTTPASMCPPSPITRFSHHALDSCSDSLPSVPMHCAPNSSACDRCSKKQKDGDDEENRDGRSDARLCHSDPKGGESSESTASTSLRSHPEARRADHASSFVGRL